MTPETMTDQQLSEAVAVEVMGWVQHPHMDDCWMRPNAKGTLDPAAFSQKHYFTPSVLIADAWAVVEKMRERGWWWSAYGNAETTTVKDVCFTFQRDEDTDAQTKFKVYAMTMPRAICLASLAAARAAVDDAKALTDPVLP